MEVMYFYGLFALTTSIAALYELIGPTLSKLDPTNNVVEYKFVTYMTFLVLGIIVAPLLLPATLVPSLGERFRNALFLALQKD